MTRTRTALLLAAVALVAVPASASAAPETEAAPTTGNERGERFVCLGKSGERPYCVTVYFPDL